MTMPLGKMNCWRHNPLFALRQCVAPVRCANPVKARYEIRRGLTVPDFSRSRRFARTLLQRNRSVVHCQPHGDS